MMAGRIGLGAGDLAFDPNICERVVVGKKFFDVRGNRANRRDPSDHAATPSRRMLSKGVPYSTACAFEAKTCPTMPEKPAGISFIVFMASMIPIVWPACTRSP